MSRFQNGKALFTTNNRGQALLIVLLVMSVILTVVLSNVSRSVTEVSISEVEEDSQRAFSAAEAGVEQVLLKQQAISSGTVGTANFSATYDDALPADPVEFVYPNTLSAGETATFWLVGHDSNGFLSCTAGNCVVTANLIEVCWGNPGTPPSGSIDIPAIEVSLVHDYDYVLDIFPNGVAASPQNFSKFTTKGIPFDTDPARVLVNSFETAPLIDCDAGGDQKIAGQDFAFTSGEILFTPAVLDIDNSCRNSAGCLIMVKVKILYNDTGTAHKVGLKVNITGGGSLPSQGKLIESTGTSGEATRQVNVFRGYPEPADVFNNALFIENNITHN